MPKSRTGWGLLIGAALLALLVVIGIVPRVRQNAELIAASTAPDAGIVQVSVIAPKRADGPIDLVLPSNIQAIEEAAIYARTNGYVRERYVERGDPAAHQHAAEKLTALAAARATTAVSQANVEAMQANLGALEASVEAARASVAASEANVQRLMALQSFQKVEAPFAGIITARGTDRGALITSGS